MASIRKRRTAGGEARWEVQIRLSGSAPQVRTFSRLSKAKRWAATEEAAIRERRAFGRRSGTHRTVGEAIDRYLQERLMDLAESDQSRRAAILRWWSDRIGHLRLSELEPEDIAAGMVALAERGLSPARQNRYVAAISKVLTLAVREWRLVDRNVARDVTRKRESAGRVRVLTDAERDVLLAACRASVERRLYPLVLLALATAARQSELIGLDWRDVDLGRGIITFRNTKNRTDRTVPLAGIARDAIAAMPRRDSGPVLELRRFPRRPWEAAVAAAGLTDFRFHDLRHTAASYLAMTGATPRELAEILGHKTLLMVMRYSHFFSSHLVGIVEKMNAKYLIKPTAPGIEQAKR